MNKPLLPGQVIGIVGGGQLGKMIALSAKKLGFYVGVLDPAADCPASQVADWQLLADYNDIDALKELAQYTQIVTYEFENVSVEALTEIEDLVSIPQGTDLLAITQDRLLEKSFLEDNNIIIAPYATIVSPTDIQDAIDGIGYPCILKTTHGGYDGHGQYILHNPSDLVPAMELLRQGACVLEALIPYEKEISILISGDGQKNYTTFPVVENIHKNNILYETIAPARIADEVIEEAERIARVIAEAVNLAGTLAIEMFLMKSGGIYVNELAPRPHNSGHYTIEACSFSQFDTHVRGICSWAMPKVDLLSKAVMVNILGDEIYGTLNLIKEKPQWQFHYYGKKETKPKRKMGHITILTDSIETTLEEISNTTIWN
ncbi:5-(carboxyamino)imidazole ribonucleotide synthase [Melissococcus plutonius]|uniref:N5-carboxyaminoimidazole ribonucleotide synthase n=2 Tax=Melissococcus plutonius TaxID=33970 RepID=F3YBB3_MELPT|nr:5-(carboxyamino)imidazole ribonucleotide synthase [Melissococcus plutonius]BAL61866.1 phosphoribosylaminoimidazole carboxylase ATPase subunit [Melissococcus plutonius DAT561]MBB5177613.1 5-(carboxyamino)imidazole ribonucleotide synthase [Melissococcus plutonius]MCV2499316.1 5-(carboxyamino)imidazole ribonucleotide synthase [Melissococcus plutonius]MCV2500959.1 5-(carboxyamino)imidazole ribonucleotide synthase [Melissococcus plutonius]MCV2505613.1 5-(carboxyamino)imidazole ribonucleotide syn